MFKVVKKPVWLDWYPVEYNETCYVGQLVKYTTSGVSPLNVSTSTPDAEYPFGVIVGFNNQTQLYDATYKNTYASAVAAQADQLLRKSAGSEGMFAKKDPALMAQVAVIGADTIVQGRIFNAAYGVAPTVVTCTTESTDGLASMVHGNVDITAQVAYWNTYCGRSGKNRGLYRTSYATSRTTPTFYLAWPNDWTVGDTFVNVSVGLGRVGIQTDAESMFIDNAGALSSYFLVDVLS